MHIHVLVVYTRGQNFMPRVHIILVLNIVIFFFNFVFSYFLFFYSAYISATVERNLFDV